MQHWAVHGCNIKQAHGPLCVFCLLLHRPLLHQPCSVAKLADAVTRVLRCTCAAAAAENSQAETMMVVLQDAARRSNAYYCDSSLDKTLCANMPCINALVFGTSTANSPATHACVCASSMTGASGLWGNTKATLGLLVDSRMLHEQRVAAEPAIATELRCESSQDEKQLIVETL